MSTPSPSSIKYTNSSNAPTVASPTGRESSGSQTQDTSMESNSTWETPRPTSRRRVMNNSPLPIALRRRLDSSLLRYMGPYQLLESQDGGRVFQTPNFGSQIPHSCYDIMEESPHTDEQSEDSLSQETPRQYGYYTDPQVLVSPTEQESSEATTTTLNLLDLGGMDTTDITPLSSTTSTEASHTEISLDGVPNWPSMSQLREVWWLSPQSVSSLLLTPSQEISGETSPIRERSGEE